MADPCFWAIFLTSGWRTDWRGALFLDAEGTSRQLLLLPTCEVSVRGTEEAAEEMEAKVCTGGGSRESCWGVGPGEGGLGVT